MQTNGAVQTAGERLPPPTRRDMAAALERLTATLERLERGQLAQLTREVRLLQRTIEAQSR